MNASFVSVAVVVSVLSLAPLAAAAPPATLNFFCMSNAQQSNVYYMTETFPAAAQVSDVNDAWRRYIAGEHADAKAGAICQAGVDLASLEALRTLTHDSIVKTAQDVVAVNWKYTAK